jgi:hypothetical protein
MQDIQKDLSTALAFGWKGEQTANFITIRKEKSHFITIDSVE